MHLSLLILLLVLPIGYSNLIITGAGTAGCALASLLCSTHPGLKITLLERGSPRTKQSSLHVRSPRLTFRAWTDETVSQRLPTTPTLPLVDALTGVTLGGSSAINGMQWTVPLNSSTMDWRLGLTESEIRGFYDRAFSRVRPRFVDGTHAYEAEYLEAAEKVGFVNKGPFEVRNEDAVWRNLLAIGKRERRRDSCRVYLGSVKRMGACENLNVLQGVTVRKVLMRKRRTGLKATGVVYEQKGVRHVIRGRVILSAGPYGSPQLLQLSGIGPRRVLENVVIRVLKDLPVGERTIARAGGVVVSLYTGVPLDPANNGSIVNSTRALQQWEMGRGVLAIPPYAFNGRLKDVGYFAAGTVFGPTIGLDVPQMWSICLLNSISEGFLRVRNRNPDDAPLLDLALLREKSDFRGMKKCMKRMKEIHAAFPKSFRLVDVQPSDLSEKSVRESTAFAFHHVGGCRVGDVVDTGFRVRDVKDLWVVDASVLNSLPASAGPMAAVYMLAHVAAERIGEQIAT